MGNSYTRYYFASDIFMLESSDKQDKILIESISDMEANKGKQRQDYEKQKATENKATLIHQLWGDNFISDSLH